MAFLGRRPSVGGRALPVGFIRMTMEELIGFGLTLLVMLIGLGGSFLPGLPGPPLILVAAVGHRLYFGDASAGNLVLGALGFLMLLSLGLDYVATLVGAKKLGATWKGVVGAAVGAVVGLFFFPIGILVGPFVGALLFELLGGRDLKAAGQAGAGAFLGLLAGTVGRIACCFAMIGIFCASILIGVWRSAA